MTERGRWASMGRTWRGGATMISARVHVGVALAVLGCWLPCEVASARPAAVTPPPLSAGLYRARRDRLRMSLPPQAVVLLYGKERIGEGARQSPDFLYLTGIEEEGAALVLTGGPMGEDLLFLAPRDPEEEAWDGRRASLSPAFSKRRGWKRILRTKSLEATLARLCVRERDLVVIEPIARPSAPVPKVLATYRRMRERAPWVRIRPFTEALVGLRAVKDLEEVRRIRAASELTVRAHQAAWRAARPGVREADVKAVLEAAMRAGGARRPAYESIVASGRRAASLHVSRDDRVIGDGELVLIDAGAEIDGYATDVTRTFPASGRFSPEQRRLYDVVLAAQKAALAVVRPGVKIGDVHKAARRVIEAAGLGAAFTHGTSHFVGLEVHDPGLFDKPLESGMVLTVEPGVYLRDKGLGIRIEDTVLVTPSGHENLSGALPREPAEIERLLSGRGSGGGRP